MESRQAAKGEGFFRVSSFLDGGSVLAAGEICVDNGVPRIITAKSGHYKPSANELLNFVRTFGGFHAEVLIRPDLGSKNHFKVGDFRANGMAATPLTRGQIMARLPPFARSTPVMSVVNTI